MDLVQVEFFADDKQTLLGNIDTDIKTVTKTEELKLTPKQHIVGVKISKGDDNFRTI